MTDSRSTSRLLLIGAGVFGYVYQTEYEGRKMAVKKPSSRTTGLPFLRESSILELLGSHPNIVSYLGMVNGGWLAFDQEDGDLRRLTGTHPQYTKAICIQLITAVLYCHQRGVLHLDIKPANVLYSIGLSGFRVRLADFGMSSHVDVATWPEGELITAWYRPLEVIDHVIFDTRSDYYSLGVTILHVMSGRCFMEGANDDETLRRELLKRYPRDLREAMGFSPHQVYAFEYGKRYEWDDEETRSGGMAKGIDTDGSYEQLLDLLSRIMALIHKERATTIDILQHPLVAPFRREIMKTNNKAARKFSREADVEYKPPKPNEFSPEVNQLAASLYQSSVDFVLSLDEESEKDFVEDIGGVQVEVRIIPGSEGSGTNETRRVTTEGSGEARDEKQALGMSNNEEGLSEEERGESTVSGDEHPQLESEGEPARRDSKEELEQREAGDNETLTPRFATPFGRDSPHSVRLASPSDRGSKEFADNEAAESSDGQSDSNSTRSTVGKPRYTRRILALTCIQMAVKYYYPVERGYHYFEKLTSEEIEDIVRLEVIILLHRKGVLRS
jgi:serine/threonine protein kinase